MFNGYCCCCGVVGEVHISHKSESIRRISFSHIIICTKWCNIFQLYNVAVGKFYLISLIKMSFPRYCCCCSCSRSLCVFLSKPPLDEFFENENEAFAAKASAEQTIPIHTAKKRRQDEEDPYNPKLAVKLQ